MKGVKFCTKCGLGKALENFKLSKRSSDGRYSWCKLCEADYRKTRSTVHQEYMKEYYTNNKAKLAKYMANYHQNHREARNEYTKAYYRARRMNHLEHDILHRCKSRAKKHEIPFNITVEDIVIPEVCPVLGILLDRGGIGRKGGRPESPSLDRLIPKLGYVKGNVRVISNRANTLKCDASVDELEKVLADVKRINQLL